jgi:ABC-type polysaccharide/polyol phosphate export permease
MELIIISVLALAVVLGSVMVSRGVQRFNLPTGAVAVAFTLTAVFWLALLIAAIGMTVRTIALAQL